MRKNKNTFYCFSPPVMLATFVIEVLLALYIMLFRKASAIQRTAVVMLGLLAAFQLAEYAVCEGPADTTNIWATFGFVVITFLPPTGLYLVHQLAGVMHKKLLILSYGLAIGWSIFYVLSGNLTGSTCGGNYVIFHIKDPYELIYYYYYDALLLLAVIQSCYYALKTTDKHRRISLISVSVGYLAFIIPSMIFVSASRIDGTDSELPSVMCGFAVLLALVLSFSIVPTAEKIKSAPTKRR